MLSVMTPLLFLFLPSFSIQEIQDASPKFWMYEVDRLERADSPVFKGVLLSHAWSFQDIKISAYETVLRNPKKKQRMFVALGDGSIERVLYREIKMIEPMDTMIVGELENKEVPIEPGSLIGLIDLNDTPTLVPKKGKRIIVPDTLVGLAKTALTPRMTQAFRRNDYEWSSRVLGKNERGVFRLFVQADIPEKLRGEHKIQSAGFLIDVAESSVTLIKDFYSAQKILFTSFFDLDEDGLADVFAISDEGESLATRTIVGFWNGRLILIDVVNAC
jgi:hypothetical protein